MVRIVQFQLGLFVINGFTRACFMALGKTPRDSEFLTIFVIQTPRLPTAISKSLYPPILGVIRLTRKLN